MKTYDNRYNELNEKYITDMSGMDREELLEFLKLNDEYLEISCLNMVDEEIINDHKIKINTLLTKTLLRNNLYIGFGTLFGLFKESGSRFTKELLLNFIILNPNPTIKKLFLNDNFNLFRNEKEREYFTERYNRIYNTLSHKNM